MPDGMTLEEYQRAEVDMNRRAGRRGFAVHALIYVLSMIAFVTIDLIGSSGVIWFPYALVGWGIGLLIHYWSAVRWSGGDIERHQRAVEKHARKLAG